jgi:hypothetical protein
MSRERLQEHFTDLYEGTLDPGLAQQIARKFEADSQLKADYDRFSETMNLLAIMPDEKIEIPSFLSSRIAERLDTAETQQKSSIFSGAWLRNLSFGALGLVALTSGFVAVRKQQDSSTVQASAVGLPSAPRKNLDMVELHLVKNQPVLTYSSSGPKTVTVNTEGGKQQIKKYDLNGNPMECPLVNDQAGPAVFEVEATGDSMKHIFVVPGSDKDYEAKGEGSITQFAKIVSVKYGKTIHLQLPGSKAVPTLKWDITNTNPQTAVSEALSAAEYSVSTASDGVLSISAHN